MNFFYICFIKYPMILKYSKTTLNKLEQIFKESDYVIRYEKGQFKSGHCLIHDKKIIIINKFFDTKGRIENMLDILMQVNVSDNVLSDRSKEFLNVIEKEYLQENKLVA